MSLLYYHCFRAKSKCSEGRTDLHCASQDGNLKRVKELVEQHQCDPLCCDDKHVTPLHLAALSGKLEVVRYFIQSVGIDPEVKDLDSQVPLHYAAKTGHLDVVVYLTETMKCNVNPKAKVGFLFIVPLRMVMLTL